MLFGTGGGLLLDPRLEQILDLRVVIDSKIRFSTQVYVTVFNVLYRLAMLSLTFIRLTPELSIPAY